MKNNHRQKIEQALLYIESSLKDKISVEQVAQQVFLSPFHFQRLFREILGESVSQYRINRRLERVANQMLQQPETGIIDIAFEWGFESHSAFSKAFKKHFGISPKQFREEPSDITNIGDASRPFLNSHQRTLPNLDIRTIELPSLYFHFKQNQGNKNGTFFEQNLSTVQSDLGALTRSQLPECYGVGSGFPGSPKSLNDEKAIIRYGGLYRQKIQSQWSDNWQSIQAGLWAVCIHSGSYDYLYQSWSRFIHSWLPVSGFELRDELAFELYYGPGHDEIAKPGDTLLYLPIKTAGLEQNET